jgi:hypothetical protein
MNGLFSDYSADGYLAAARVHSVYIFWHYTDQYEGVRDERSTLGKGMLKHGVDVTPRVPTLAHSSTTTTTTARYYKNP